MTALDRLRRLCPPPPRRSQHVDWEPVERNLGTRLPEDYKQLVEAYGPGGFKDFLSLYQPQAPLPTIDIEVQSPRVRAAFASQQDDDHPMPRPVQDLQLAGVTGNGNYLVWLTDPAADPSSWPVAVNEARGRRWFTFDGTLTDFLIGFLTNTVVVPMFPDDLLDKPPAFTPFQPGTPAGDQAGAAGTVSAQPSPATSLTLHGADVREWARHNGYNVPERGRIPGAVLDAYAKAHGLA